MVENFSDPFLALTYLLFLPADFKGKREQVKFHETPDSSSLQLILITAMYTLT